MPDRCGDLFVRQDLHWVWLLAFLVEHVSCA